MKRFLITVVLAIALVGCAVTPKVLTTYPDDCVDSIILSKCDPEVMGTLIQLANLKAIQKERYKKEEAILALETIKLILEQDTVSFNDFIYDLRLLTGKCLVEHDIEFVLLNSMLMSLSVDIPIPAYDKRLFVSLCDKILNQLKKE